MGTKQISIHARLTLSGQEWSLLSVLVDSLSNRRACSERGFVPLAATKLFVTIKLFSDHEWVFIFLCATANQLLSPSNDNHLLPRDVIQSFALFMWPSWFHLHQNRYATSSCCRINIWLLLKLSNVTFHYRGNREQDKSKFCTRKVISEGRVTHPITCFLWYWASFSL